MRKFFLLLFSCICIITGNAQDSVGFYASVNGGSCGVTGSYSSSGTHAAIGFDPNSYGFADNGFGGIATIGFDWCKPKLRVEITESYNRNPFSVNNFLVWKLSSTYYEETSIPTINTGNYLINTLMVNLTKYFGIRIITLGFRAGYGFMYWAFPAINADFIDRNTGSTVHSINISSAKASMPCMNIGASLQVKIVKHIALTLNEDFTFGIQRPSFKLPYTVTGYPTGIGFPPSSGTFNYNPRSPQYFNSTLGVEFILYHYKKTKATN